MPAPTTTLPSLDLALLAAGNMIGCTTGGTLTVSQALDDAVHDGLANWMAKTDGVRSWSVQADGLVDASGGDLITGHATGAPLTVTIDTDPLKGLTEAGLSFSLNLTDVVNATSGMSRTLDPNTRSFELSLSFDYYDPLATGSDAFKAIQDTVLGVSTEPLGVVVSVGGLSFTFDARPTTTSLTKSAQDIVKTGVTLVADGPVINNSSGLGTGLAGLLSAFLATDAATPLTVLLGTQTVDASEYTGSAYPASVSITAPYAGQVTVSATLEGTGALTRQATT
ncbi:hypothetical protein B1759_14960 [Rubrivirga sp. SAORIC476]|uniref:hypothetical protein n=1 Tax=Rubrivirga sp. SAORIC476 TaxID=1961794 RepID=UPI000BA9457A|nr:hypothetical protein [Rubrivirga sp. SAORIC476]PAP79618.1 hypothetical protein B1759_14960 [Rubrivirga sp. SAORIC476]